MTPALEKTAPALVKQEDRRRENLADVREKLEQKNIPVSKIAEFADKLNSAPSRLEPNTSKQYPYGESMSYQRLDFKVDNINIQLQLSMPPKAVENPGCVIFISSTLCENLGCGGHWWSDKDCQGLYPGQQFLFANNVVWTINYHKQNKKRSRP